MHDFSEFLPLELSVHGTFGYRWLDSYFTAASDREAYLITMGGLLAGFAMVSCDAEGDVGVWSISEFFIVRRHRRRGIAREAARQLFQRHPGTWTLSYLHDNTPAACFWPLLVNALSDGPVGRTEQHPPAVPAAKSILRFRVAPE